MSGMTEVKVSELSGPALAYSVAISEGLGGDLSWCLHANGSFQNIWTEDCDCYRPDELWEIGGLLIASHAIGFVGHDADNWLAFSAPCDVTHQGIGATHLIAACRAIVVAKLGESVQVPTELL